MKTYTKSSVRWHIELGARVVERRTGRSGHATQVTSDRVFVRFDGADKDSYLDRDAVIPQSVIDAMREVDEDEANAAAFAASR